jgi:NADH-quinone oxidoreductase subunit C
LSKKAAPRDSHEDDASEAIGTVLAALSDKVVEQGSVSDSHASAKINPQEIRNVATAVKNSLDGAIGETIVAVDLLNSRYELIYYFWSLIKKVMIEVRTQVEGDAPTIDSICYLFPGLDWHEREIHEMFGISFNGHPNQSLLILPDELEGKYPLRKSFEVSRERLKESGITSPIARSNKAVQSTNLPAGVKTSESK